MSLVVVLVIFRNSHLILSTSTNLIYKVDLLGRNRSKDFMERNDQDEVLSRILSNWFSSLNIVKKIATKN